VDVLPDQFYGLQDFPVVVLSEFFFRIHFRVLRVLQPLFGEHLLLVGGVERNVPEEVAPGLRANGRADLFPEDRLQIIQRLLAKEHFHAIVFDLLVGRVFRTRTDRPVFLFTEHLVNYP
jgi:hypothetical protein